MAKYVIVETEGIPCEVLGKEVEFDAEGNRISAPLEWRWPMPWIEEVISEYDLNGGRGGSCGKVRLFNPDEPDQYIEVLESSYFDGFKGKIAAKEGHSGAAARFVRESKDL